MSTEPRPPSRPRSVYRAWRAIPTRWMDNEVYGHVNNTVYYSWFDTAVNAWLVEQKLIDIERGQLIGLVVETGCRYAQSVAFPDEVEAGIRATRIGRTSVTSEVGLFIAGASQAAAEGFFVHVYCDRQTRRPGELPDRWRRMIATISA